MWWRRAITWLLPPAPRLVTARSLVTPLVVLGLVGVAWLANRSAHWLGFARPQAFLALALAPWFWWLHQTGRAAGSRLRQELVLAARLVLLVLLALVLARPQAIRVSDQLAVIYALDRSDSLGEKTADQALRYVLRTVAEKPGRDMAGLVVFGRHAAVELPPRASFPFEAVNVRVQRDGTNLGRALSLAAALAPEGQPTRIVLISDGVETEGNVTAVLDELRARRIPVDVLPIHYDYPHEAWLERLELPRHVKTGETYEAGVLLSSLAAGSGRLVLRENGQVIAEETISFQAGRNRFQLPLYMRGPGYYEYTATLEMPEGRDGCRENNTAVGSIYLEGKGKVLVVVDPEGSYQDHRPLVQALRQTDRDVEVVTPATFPPDVSALLPYHVVVVVNVPADAFTPPQLVTIHDAIHGQGTGFLMVGGELSFGAGGYRGSPVEKALPVTMDVKQKKILPKGALAICLHTCEFPEGNTWAKRITKAAIRVLGSEDDVGVLASNWSGSDYWIFPLSAAWGRDDMFTLLNSAEIGDMPAFGPSMEMGLEALQASDAAMKHMIIISDGDPEAPPVKLLRRFQQARVSITTVIINPHGNTSVALMKKLANATGGRFYYPDNPSALPRIFIKEARTLRRNLIQNKTFTPAYRFPSPALKGITSLPPLHGHVLTTPRPRAQVVLEVPDTGSIEPVLATWRYGLGKTAAFTSDLGGNWGRDWVTWDHYRSFVQQLVAHLARSAGPSSLRVNATVSGTTGVLTVEDTAPDPRPEVPAAAVRDPAGNVARLELAAVGPGRYRGFFPVQTRGRYQVVVSGVGKDRTEEAVEFLTVPYSAEYLRFRTDPLALRRIAERTGGRLLTGGEGGRDIFVEKREARQRARPVFDWFLILLACLLPLEVALRRLQIDPRLLLGWIVPGQRDPAASGETLGGLLRRKAEIVYARGRKKRPVQSPAGKGPDPTASDPEQAPQAAGEPAAPPAAPVPDPAPSTSKTRPAPAPDTPKTRATSPGPTRPADRPTPRDTTPAPEPPKAAPTGPAGKEPSTTERLLELKRRRKKDG